MGDITVKENATQQTTPSLGYWRIYPKADGLYLLDDQGVEKKLAFDAGSSVFGNNFKVVENYIHLTISSITPITFLTMNTSILPLGDYRIGYNYAWSYDDQIGNRANIDIYANGVAHLPEPVQMETKNIDDVPLASGFFYLENTSGAKTIEIKGWCDDINDTLTFHSGYIEIWRVK